MSKIAIEESAFPAAAILAVDDYPANLLALSALLEPLGCPLATAHSGPEALELAATTEFAVILLDVMMPGMDGFETLARLRSTPNAEHVPVILVTAYELDARAMERVQGMGTVDYILKPIAPELLRSKVAAFVSLHRRGEELRRRGEALAAKDRNIAMLAHDLQNPLAGVATSASLLLRADLDPRHHKTAERISRSVARMSEMIRNLTDYARAGRGAIPIAPGAMDSASSATRSSMTSRARNRNIVSTLGAVASFAANGIETVSIRRSPNLLGNALRHGDGDVVVRAQGDESHVEVAVCNSGPPIPPELLPVIFQPFERGAQDGAGLGLGLYIVREITRAHQGEVSVTSSLEHGTTFALQLPRLPASKLCATP